MACSRADLSPKNRLKKDRMVRKILREERKRKKMDLWLKPTGKRTWSRASSGEKRREVNFVHEIFKDRGLMEMFLRRTRKGGRSTSICERRALSQQLWVQEKADRGATSAGGGEGSVETPHREEVAREKVTKS